MGIPKSNISIDRKEVLKPLRKQAIHIVPAIMGRANGRIGLIDAGAGQEDVNLLPIIEDAGIDTSNERNSLCGARAPMSRSSFRSEQVRGDRSQHRDRAVDSILRGFLYPTGFRRMQIATHRMIGQQCTGGAGIIDRPR